MTQDERVAGIARYQAAYEAANGKPCPKVWQKGGWYYVGQVGMSPLRWDALMRAAGRLEAKTAHTGENAR